MNRLLFVFSFTFLMVACAPISIVFASDGRSPSAGTVVCGEVIVDNRGFKKQVDFVLGAEKVLSTIESIQSRTISPLSFVTVGTDQAMAILVEKSQELGENVGCMRLISAILSDAAWEQDSKTLEQFEVLQDHLTAILNGAEPYETEVSKNTSGEDEPDRRSSSDFITGPGIERLWGDEMFIVMRWLEAGPEYDVLGNEFSNEIDDININENSKYSIYKLRLDYSPLSYQYLIHYENEEICNKNGCPIRILQPLTRTSSHRAGFSEILQTVRATSLKIRDDLLSNYMSKIELCQNKKCYIMNYSEMFGAYIEMNNSQLIEEQEIMSKLSGQGVPQPPSDSSDLINWATTHMPIADEDREWIDPELSNIIETDLDSDPRTREYLLRLGGSYFCGASLCEHYAFRFISDGQHAGRIDLELPATSSIIARVLETTGPSGFRTIELCGQSGCGTWNKRDGGGLYELTESSSSFNPKGPILTELKD